MAAAAEASETTASFQNLAVSNENSPQLFDLLKAQHVTIIRKLEFQEDLLQQVMMNTSLKGLDLVRPELAGGPDVDDAAADAAIQPVEDDNSTPHGPNVRPITSGGANAFPKGLSSAGLSTGDVGSPSNGSVRPRRPSLVSSLHSCYTEEDLGRFDIAQSKHGDMVRQRYSSRNPAPVHKKSASSKHTLVQRLVLSTGFEMFFAAVVFTNALFIGVEVQASIDSPGWRPISFQILHYTYTFLFTMEICLRVAATGCHHLFCTEVWLWSCLDVFIVISSMWDIIVEAMQNSDLSAVGGVSSLKAFRIIRLTRTLRTVQFVRIFRFVVALRTLLTSIITTLKALAWALLLLGLIIYVFAVMFSQAVSDFLIDPDSPPLPEREHEACLLYFGSLLRTMTSLFMSITGGTNWEELVFPLEMISPLWTCLFLFYIAFTYLAVLNVVTGFFCQGAIESAQKDQQTLVQTMLDNKEAHLKRIKELFCEMGNTEPGITFATFQENVQRPAVRAYFETLGLDIRDEWSFFKLLDDDGDGIVEVEEFFLGCLKYRGEASAMDVGHLQQDQRWLIARYGHTQTALEEELLQIKEQMGKVSWLLAHLHGRCTIQI